MFNSYVNLPEGTCWRNPKQCISCQRASLEEIHLGTGEFIASRRDPPKERSDQLTQSDVHLLR